MTEEQSKAVKFLIEMAHYFEKQTTKTKEDSEFWAAVNNAESCRNIASLIARMSHEIQAVSR